MRKRRSLTRVTTHLPPPSRISGSAPPSNRICGRRGVGAGGQRWRPWVGAGVAVPAPQRPASGAVAHLHGGRLHVARGHVQGRVALPVLQVGVGARSQQQLEAGRRPHRRSKVQGAASVLVNHLGQQGGSALQQLPHGDGITLGVDGRQGTTASAAARVALERCWGRARMWGGGGGGA
jgi:hypothetical protein